MATMTFRAFLFRGQDRMVSGFQKSTFSIVASDEAEMRYKIGPQPPKPGLGWATTLEPVAPGGIYAMGLRGFPLPEGATFHAANVTWKGKTHTVLTIALPDGQKALIGMGGAPLPEFQSLATFRAVSKELRMTQPSGPAGPDKAVKLAFLTSNTGLTDQDRLTLPETGAPTGPILLGKGNDRATGNAQDNHINLGAGRDTAEGGAGHDSLVGGRGNDSLTGGAGNDTLAGHEGTDRLAGGTGNDSLTGGAGNDTLEGDAGNDTLLGGAGDDSLSSLVDDDLLDGGDGADTLSGAFGRSTLLGGAGDDLLLGGMNRDSLHGGDGNDSLVGGNGAEWLYGDAGNDTITGGEGNDTIGDPGVDRLGLGDDVMAGGPGTDQLTGGAGNDTMSGNAGQDSLYGGDGDDLLNGGDGNDLLVGDAGRDTLLGGDGNDTLWGRGGENTVTGGAGRDTFAFTPGGGDAFEIVVTDFTYGEDAIFDTFFAGPDEVIQRGDEVHVIWDDDMVTIFAGALKSQIEGALF